MATSPSAENTMGEIDLCTPTDIGHKKTHCREITPKDECINSETCPTLRSNKTVDKTTSWKEKGHRLSKRKLFLGHNVLLNSRTGDGSVHGSTEKRKRTLCDVKTSHSVAVHSSSPAGATIKRPLTERQQLAFLLEATSNQAEGADKVGHDVTSPFTKIKSRKGNARLYRRNERGETLLHIAAIKGDVSGIKKLIKEGADVGIKDYAGWTPLHEACNHGNLAAAKVLLERGAIVNVPGFEGDTPLHDAVINTHVQIVNLLLSFHANPLQPNTRGITPIDLVKSSEMNRIFTSHGIETSWSQKAELTDSARELAKDDLHKETQAFDSQESDGRQLTKEENNAVVGESDMMEGCEDDNEIQNKLGDNSASGKVDSNSIGKIGENQIRRSIREEDGFVKEGEVDAVGKNLKLMVVDRNISQDKGMTVKREVKKGREVTGLAIGSVGKNIESIVVGRNHESHKKVVAIEKEIRKEEGVSGSAVGSVGKNVKLMLVGRNESETKGMVFERETRKEGDTESKRVGSVGTSMDGNEFQGKGVVIDQMETSRKEGNTESKCGESVGKRDGLVRAVFSKKEGEVSTVSSKSCENKGIRRISFTKRMVGLGRNNQSKGSILNEIQRKQTQGESKMEKPVMYICKLAPGKSDEEMTVETTTIPQATCVGRGHEQSARGSSDGASSDDGSGRVGVEGKESPVVPLAREEEKSRLPLAEDEGCNAVSGSASTLIEEQEHVETSEKSAMQIEEEAPADVAKLDNENSLSSAEIDEAGLTLLSNVSSIIQHLSPHKLDEGREAKDSLVVETRAVNSVETVGGQGSPIETSTSQSKQLTSVNHAEKLGANIGPVARKQTELTEKHNTEFHVVSISPSLPVNVSLTDARNSDKIELTSDSRLSRQLEPKDHSEQPPKVSVVDGNNDVGIGKQRNVDGDRRSVMFHSRTSSSCLDEVHQATRNVAERPEALQRRDLQTRKTRQRFVNCNDDRLSRIRKPLMTWRSLANNNKHNISRIRIPGYDRFLINTKDYEISIGETTLQEETPTSVALGLSEKEKLILKQEEIKTQLTKKQQSEKDKLQMSMEQEIVRFHSKDAYLFRKCIPPPGVCDILRWQKMTPVQLKIEKNKLNQQRYSSEVKKDSSTCLEEIKNKYEKLKKTMAIRHRHEQQALDAINKRKLECF